MSVGEIPDKLRGYKWRIDAMRPHLSDWISQNDFDRFERQQFNEPACVDGRHKDAPILSFVRPWLHLLQILVQNGIAEAEDREGVIYYRFPPAQGNEK